MKYNPFNWRTIIGALLVYGGGAEFRAIWIQYHAFNAGLFGALIIIICGLFLLTRGLMTKKDK